MAKRCGAEVERRTQSRKIQDDLVATACVASGRGFSSKHRRVLALVSFINGYDFFRAQKFISRLLAFSIIFFVSFQTLDGSIAFAQDEKDDLQSRDLRGKRLVERIMRETHSGPRPTESIGEYQSRMAEFYAHVGPEEQALLARRKFEDNRLLKETTRIMREAGVHISHEGLGETNPIRESYDRMRNLTQALRQHERERLAKAKDNIERERIVSEIQQERMADKLARAELAKVLAPPVATSDYAEIMQREVSEFGPRWRMQRLSEIHSRIMERMLFYDKATVPGSSLLRPGTQAEYTRYIEAYDLFLEKIDRETKRSNLSEDRAIEQAMEKYPELCRELQKSYEALDDRISGKKDRLQIKNNFRAVARKFSVRYGLEKYPVYDPRRIADMGVFLGVDVLKFFTALAIYEFARCMMTKDPLICKAFLQSLEKQETYIGFVAFVLGSQAYSKVYTPIMAAAARGPKFWRGFVRAGAGLGMGVGSVASDIYHSLYEHPYKKLLDKTYKIPDAEERQKMRDDLISAWLGDTLGKRDWWMEKIPTITSMLISSKISHFIVDSVLIGQFNEMRLGQIGKKLNKLQLLKKAGKAYDRGLYARLIRSKRLIRTYKNASPFGVRAFFRAGRITKIAYVFRLGGGVVSLVAFMAVDHILAPIIKHEWDTAGYQREIRDSIDHLKQQLTSLPANMRGWKTVGNEEGVNPLIPVLNSIRDVQLKFEDYRSFLMQPAMEVKTNYETYLAEFEARTDKIRRYYEWISGTGMARDDAYWLRNDRGNRAANMPYWAYEPKPWHTGDSKANRLWDRVLPLEMQNRLLVDPGEKKNITMRDLYDQVSDLDKHLDDLDRRYQGIELAVADLKKYLKELEGKNIRPEDEEEFEMILDETNALITQNERVMKNVKEEQAKVERRYDNRFNLLDELWNKLPKKFEPSRFAKEFDMKEPFDFLYGALCGPPPAGWMFKNRHNPHEVTYLDYDYLDNDNNHTYQIQGSRHFSMWDFAVGAHIPLPLTWLGFSSDTLIPHFGKDYILPYRILEDRPSNLCTPYRSYGEMNEIEKAGLKKWYETFPQMDAKISAAKANNRTTRAREKKYNDDEFPNEMQKAQMGLHILRLEWLNARLDAEHKFFRYNPETGNERPVEEEDNMRISYAQVPSYLVDKAKKDGEKSVKWARVDVQINKLPLSTRASYAQEIAGIVETLRRQDITAHYYGLLSKKMSSILDDVGGYTDMRYGIPETSNPIDHLIHELTMWWEWADEYRNKEEFKGTDVDLLFEQAAKETFAKVRSFESFAAYLDRDPYQFYYPDQEEHERQKQLKINLAKIPEMPQIQGISSPPSLGEPSLEQIEKDKQLAFKQEVELWNHSIQLLYNFYLSHSGSKHR